MRPLIIVVEGLTEQQFVKECLAPYLYQQYGIFDVSARELGVPGNKGGKVSFARLKLDIGLLLKQRAEAVVSMLVDYYAMQTDFPNYETCQKLPQTALRIECLERGLNEAIGSRRFRAYFQQYEFEALLFASGKPLTTYLNEATCQAIANTRQTVSTPEDINTTHPPSYRLAELFENHQEVGYKKTFHGPILALELGIEAMLADCPRFATWVRSLTELASLP
jgi:hypothetical protein